MMIKKKEGYRNRKESRRKRSVIWQSFCPKGG